MVGGELADAGFAGVQGDDGEDVFVAAECFGAFSVVEGVVGADEHRTDGNGFEFREWEVLLPELDVDSAMGDALADAWEGEYPFFPGVDACPLFSLLNNHSNILRGFFFPNKMITVAKALNFFSSYPKLKSHLL